MLSNLRVREKQMASALNMSYVADRFFLLLLLFFSHSYCQIPTNNTDYEDFTLRFDQCITILNY
jgi:hypothetical protein